MRAFLYAICAGACMGGAAALVLLRYASDGERDPRRAASLCGTLYLEKSRRLALYWENGDFELWDTGRGRRLGRVERLSRRVGWCIASPDESIILTADRMLDRLNSADRDLLWKKFIPSLIVWDAQTGKRKHLIRVPEASGHPYYIHEWYARWLDKSRVLIVRLLRENSARAASQLRLIVVDTAIGKVAKASGEFKFAGEHLFLSPDRNMALVKDDNYLYRPKDGKGVGGSYRNIYARTHVFDLERLAVVSAWREPPDTPGGEGEVALIARWCPDGNTVVTVSDGWSNDHPSPKARLWDARRGRLLQTFSGHKDHILDIALTTTGDKLLTASEDHTLRVWATRTGKLEAVLSGHSAGLNKVVVLPGDKLAASAAEETTAKLWDLATYKLKFDLPVHDSAVRELEAISETVVRTVTVRGTATTWDSTTGKRLRVTPEPPKYPKRFGICQLIEESGRLYIRVKEHE